LVCDTRSAADIVAAERADVIERPLLATHHPIAVHKVGIGGVGALLLEHGFVEAGRQRIDEVYIAGEFAVLLARHARGYEDAEMADRLVDGIDDGLTVGAHFLDVVVKIENPAQRLLRRRDVVALGAEHHDRRADIAQVDGIALRGLDLARREMIADEQLVDDELNLFGIEIDVATPPALEAEIARRLGIDLGIEIVLLAPQRIGRVLVLEVLHQPGAVELAGAEIARQSGEPAAAEQAA
jgi:hypothetical protein